MIATCELSLLDLWRRQFGRRHRNRDSRPLGALGYLANGPVVEDLIEVEKLLLVVVHDETNLSGSTTTRLAGYTGSAIPWGVRWGGPENSQFLKNPLLQPMAGAHGLRLDAASKSLLQLALLLDRDIERHLDYGRRCKRPQVRLPRLWAGFRATKAQNLHGDGPELAAYCARTGHAAPEALAAIRRDYFGLLLYPLAWVSHHWEQAVAVFADLHRFPLRQVFPLGDPSEDLIGHQEAAEYDFLHTRFREPRAALAVAEAEDVAAV